MERDAQRFVAHADPALFGLTAREADAIRMRYLRSSRKECSDRRSGLLKLKLSLDSKDKWLPEMLIDGLDDELDKLERGMAFIRRKQDSGGRQAIDVELLKSSVPIRLVLELFHVAVYNRFFFKVRNERTPSAHFNEAKNVWYDHGASTGGSVIDLYMALAQCDLYTAIKELARMM